MMRSDDVDDVTCLLWFAVSGRNGEVDFVVLLYLFLRFTLTALWNEDVEVTGRAQVESCRVTQGPAACRPQCEPSADSPQLLAAACRNSNKLHRRERKVSAAFSSAALLQYLKPSALSQSEPLTST